MAETRRNVVTNPTAGVSAADYLQVAGTSGVANISRQAIAGWNAQQGVARTTWTVATTAVSGGIQYGSSGSATACPVTASTAWAFSCYVKTNLAAQRVRMQVQFYNSSGAVVGSTILGTETVIGGASWYRLSILTTTPVAAARAVISVLAVAGTSAVNWAVSSTLEMDGVLVEQSASLGTYFDGSTDGAAAHWVEQPHLSATSYDVDNQFAYQGRSQTQAHTTGAGTATASKGSDIEGNVLNNLAVLLVACKPDTQVWSPSGAGEGAGWTYIGESSGGTGAFGADTGPTKIRAWYKVIDVVNASTVPLTATGTANSSVLARILYFDFDTSGTLTIQSVGAADTTTGTAASWSFASPPALEAYDKIIVMHSYPTDIIPTYGSGALTYPGMTGLGENADFLENPLSTTGHDMGGRLTLWQYDSGAYTTGNVVYSYTLSGTTTNAAGPALLIRMHNGISNAAVVTGSATALAQSAASAAGASIPIGKATALAQSAASTAANVRRVGVATALAQSGASATGRVRTQSAGTVGGVSGATVIGRVRTRGSAGGSAQSAASAAGQVIRVGTATALAQSGALVVAGPVTAFAASTALAQSGASAAGRVRVKTQGVVGGQSGASAAGVVRVRATSMAAATGGASAAARVRIRGTATALAQSSAAANGNVVTPSANVTGRATALAQSNVAAASRTRVRGSTTAGAAALASALARVRTRGVATALAQSGASAQAVRTHVSSGTVGGVSGASVQGRVRTRGAATAAATSGASANGNVVLPSQNVTGRATALAQSGATVRGQVAVMGRATALAQAGAAALATITRMATASAQAFSSAASRGLVAVLGSAGGSAQSTASITGRMRVTGSATASAVSGATARGDAYEPADLEIDIAPPVALWAVRLIDLDGPPLQIEVVAPIQVWRVTRPGRASERPVLD